MPCRNGPKLSKPDARTCCVCSGEASALKNQLVQIGEYLSAIDRDSARCQRDEQSRQRRSGPAGVASRADCREQMAARQMELESTADRKRRVEEELKSRKSQRRRSAAQFSINFAPKRRVSKRARIRSKKSFRIAHIQPKA